MERDHPRVAQVVLGFRWLTDGITEDERMALGYINGIAAKLEAEGRYAGGPYRTLGEHLGSTRDQWLTDDITGEEREYLNLILTEVDDPGRTIAALRYGP